MITLLRFRSKAAERGRWNLPAPGLTPGKERPFAGLLVKMWIVERRQDINHMARDGTISPLEEWDTPDRVVMNIFRDAERIAGRAGA